MISGPLYGSGFFTYEVVLVVRCRMNVGRRDVEREPMAPTPPKHCSRASWRVAVVDRTHLSLLRR